MKIYFATHATSRDNEAKISSGWKDTELSQLGIRQSKELGERFKDIKIDLICCSDLKRARDTVEIAFGDEYPIVVDERLRELNYGIYNGDPSDVVNQMKKEHIQKPFPNGESYEQAMERIHEFYHELKQKYPDKMVLIVGHSATKYGLDTLVDGKTLKECIGTSFEWQPFWEYYL